jgi:sensor c-di-GMP phosphodiesterase-like protein
LRSGKTADASVRWRVSRLRLVGPTVYVGEAKYADLEAKVTV